jgi:hypothetical protein
MISSTLVSLSKYNTLLIDINKLIRMSNVIVYDIRDARFVRKESRNPSMVQF